MSFKMKHTIKNDLLPLVKKGRRTGSKLKKVVFLVAHDVGNDGLNKSTGKKNGTTAKANISYYRSTPTVEASAHVFIDFEEILVCVPLTEKAWHVIYNKPMDNLLFGVESNDAAIGVELCYYPEDKNKTLLAYQKYVWYLAYLCHVYDLQPLKHITGHHILDPGRKSDPLNALKYLNKDFKELLADVQKEYNECIKSATVVVPVPVPVPVPVSEKIMWGKTELKKGQIGKMTILKPINLWIDGKPGKLEMVRTLNPDEEYRVYGYRDLHGGQYDVGGGSWVTKMDGYLKYETPSKEMIKAASML